MGKGYSESRGGAGGARGLSKTEITANSTVSKDGIYVVTAGGITVTLGYPTEIGQQVVIVAGSGSVTVALDSQSPGADVTTTGLGVGTINDQTGQVFVSSSLTNWVRIV
jgi:hypothetical protein